MKTTTRSSLVALLLALGATGCGDELVPSTPVSGACVGLKTDAPITDDPDELLAIGTHVPPGMNVYCSTKRSFAWEGGVVDLVWVAYGSPLTVPATPNTVCALDQGDGASKLFDAVWANGEAPLTIGAECPAIAADPTGDTAVQCTAPPVSGRDHPVLADRNFRQFFSAPQQVPSQLAVCGRFLPPGPR